LTSHSSSSLLSTFFVYSSPPPRDLPSFPTRRSSDLTDTTFDAPYLRNTISVQDADAIGKIERGEFKELSCSYRYTPDFTPGEVRSEEHTSELQSRFDLVCRLLLEKKKLRI